LLVERLADRILPAGDLLATTPLLQPTDRLDTTLGAPGEVDLFQFTLDETGQMTVSTAGLDLDTRTCLLGPDGQLLIQSDGASATDPDDRIVQHLVPGTYFLQVEGLGGGTGSYTLTTEFVPAVPPFRPLPVGPVGEFGDLVTGDFNGDGFSDLVKSSPQSPDVLVYLGLGDGTFRQQQEILKGGDFNTSLAEGDFNGDGRLDLAIGHRFNPVVTLVLGRGDGTFGEPVQFAVGVEGDSVATADFNGDGFLDLAVANHVSNDLSILLGQGDGTFRDQICVPVAGGPNKLLVADFNRDGRADLASVNFDTDDVSILLGQGDGTFQNEGRFPVGDGPFRGDVGDFNGDGFLDLAVTNDGSAADLSVLLGRGDGTFGDERRLAVGGGPVSVKACDFNGDGRLDLAVSNATDLSVFLGRGDGTFTDPARCAAGLVPRPFVASDFNGDGSLDLAAASSGSLAISILFGRGDGTFSSQGRVEEGPSPWSSVAGDFNGDGRLDLATTNTNLDAVAVSLGLGDGTFQPPVLFATNANPRGITMGDFNGDGRLDLATTSSRTDDVMILLGLGDGTFQTGLTFKVDRGGVNRQFDVRTGDFNSDGRLDLAVANSEGGTISVLLGRGDGTFDDQVLYEVGRSQELVVGDFNGDGRLDLVAGGFVDPEIAVLLGRGDGTFQEPARFAVATKPKWLTAADFNGDGRLDLATANGEVHFTPGIVRGGVVSVLLGRGDGTFQEDVPVASGNSPLSPVAGDFNGDGRQDLAFTNFDTGQVSVLSGRGDGTFDAPVRFEVGGFPFGPFPGDFNGDGRDDLAFKIRGIADELSTATVVLLREQDGMFEGPLRSAFSTSLTSTSLATGDLNNDGRLDVVTSLLKSDKAGIFLGRGDGTFQDAPPSATGTAPVFVQTGDFNGDGRLDLATANFLSGDVTVALGLGDGTYQDPVQFAVGTRPVSLVVGDFNGDGRLDLATANSGSDDVSVLLGRGDGTFRSEVRLAVGTAPLFLLAGDFNGDSRLDLASANYVSGDVSLLFGRGDGTFQPETRTAAVTAPIALAHGDFNRDSRCDLAVVSQTSDEVTVYLARPDGTFQESGRFAVGRLPRSLTVGDFNRDGIVDLATANNNSDDVSVLLGRGDGTFRDQVRYAVASYPFAIITTDLNGDGRVDLATANQLTSETSVLLGLGDGTFVPPDVVGTALRSTPVVADLNGDGAADIAVANRAGSILFRRGRPGEPGTFDPPVVLNPDPSYAARDLAVVATPQGPILAALDAHNSSVSLYARGAGGTLTRTGGFAVPGTLPARLAAGDLNGDRRDDLVVVVGGSTQVYVYLQGEPGASVPGAFSSTPDFTAVVGLVPSDIALVDADGDGRLDIAVTSQFAGDVRVLLNLPPAPFASGLRFRAGTGLYYLDDLTGTPQVRSGEATTALVAGNFDADPGVELVALNSGSDSFSVLQGNGSGGLLNPQAAQTFATGPRPAAAVAGRFNSDPFSDLAVLNEGTGTVSVFLGSATGAFIEKIANDANGKPVVLSAGNLPTGLSTYDVNGDGRLDVLLGNDFGDVLILLGDGDGTFQPYQRTSRGMALAVADLNGDGREDFIFANEARDRVSVQYSQAGQSFTQDRANGLLAPGAVSVADLNGDGTRDLVVANGGGNNVLVYLGVGHGQFGRAQSFFAGTNPAGITIEDLNADGLPDLVVANEGSNDVTLLLGQAGSAGWTLTPGPRLRAGMGPVSTTVHDVTGDAIPDILVSNSQSNNIAMLPGVGNGFFDDRGAVFFPTGLSPQQVLVGNFDGNAGLDMVSINAGSNDLTFFPNPSFTSPAAGLRLTSGGDLPLAAAEGDFNFDGLSDLVVVNNGDGRVTLLLGGPEGPSFASSFSNAGVPHPTAVAVTGSADVLQVYVTEEGQETAFLLTSFGIPIPVPTAPIPAVVIPDIVVVNGPGFAIDLSLIVLAGVAEWGDEQRALAPTRREGEGAEPGPPVGNLPHGHPTSPTHGGGEEGEAGAGAEADAATAEEAAVIRFMIGVDDALRAIRPAAPGRGAIGPEASMPKLLDPIAEVFRTSAVSLWSGVEDISVGSGHPWRDLVDGLFRAAAAATDDAGRVLPRRPSAEVGEESARSEDGSDPPPAIGDEDDLTVPPVAAPDGPPLTTAPEKRTVAVEDLAAGLVLAAVWKVAGTVRSEGRRAREKFTR
jgi:hypothetical protein